MLDKKAIDICIAQANKFCYYINMKKTELIQLLGKAPEIARKLDYSHRNVVYGWPDILTARQSADVIRRMKANRIRVPKEWL